MEGNIVPFVLFFGAVCTYIGIRIGRSIKPARRRNNTIEIKNLRK